MCLSWLLAVALIPTPTTSVRSDKDAAILCVREWYFVLTLSFNLVLPEMLMLLLILPEVFMLLLIFPRALFSVLYGLLYFMISSGSIGPVVTFNTPQYNAPNLVLELGFNLAFLLAWRLAYYRYGGGFL